jgi:hypothetical protein
VLDASYRVTVHREIRRLTRHSTRSRFNRNWDNRCCHRIPTGYRIRRDSPCRPHTEQHIGRVPHHKGAGACNPGRWHTDHNMGRARPHTPQRAPPPARSPSSTPASGNRGFPAECGTLDAERRESVRLTRDDTEVKQRWDSQGAVALPRIPAIVYESKATPARMCCFVDQEGRDLKNGAVPAFQGGSVSSELRSTSPPIIRPTDIDDPCPLIRECNKRVS